MGEGLSYQKRTYDSVRISFGVVLAFQDPVRQSLGKSDRIVRSISTQGGWRKVLSGGPDIEVKKSYVSGRKLTFWKMKPDPIL